MVNLNKKHPAVKKEKKRKKLNECKSCKKGDLETVMKVTGWYDYAIKEITKCSICEYEKA